MGTDTACFTRQASRRFCPSIWSGGGAASVYWWQETLEEASEAVLILKTQAKLIERLTARVKSLHPYDCPCVVALPIAGGNPEYLDWITAETAPGAAPLSPTA